MAKQFSITDFAPDGSRRRRTARKTVTPEMYERLIAAIRRRQEQAVGKPGKDGSMILGSDAGLPRGGASCPRCSTETNWRGPWPKIGDAPVRVDDRGHSSVHVMGEGEERSAAARRLYAIADGHRDGPMKLHSNLVLWQAALCGGCEKTHIDSWMDWLHPPAGQRNTSRQGDSEID